MAQTIGEQLKQARIDRGLTIDQVVEATRLRKHFIEALENDQRDALPSNVQGRGFLRLYASYLDLPVEPLLEAWGGVPVLPRSSLVATAFPMEDLRPAGRTTLAGKPGEPGTGTNIEAGGAGEETISSSAIFMEIGQKLREQRENLGLSYTEIERYTRLRQRYIQALEDGQIDLLPSPVHGRGMLSNYTAFLNLDEEAFLLRFAEGLQARRIERLPKPEAQPIFAQKKRPARRAAIWRRFLTPDLLFGLTVVIIILFFALWSASRINTLRSIQQEPTAPAISEILLTPAGLQTPLAPEIISPPSDQTVISAQSTTEQATATALQEITATPPPASGGATLSPLNKDPLQIYIIARQRAWLKVVADDKVKFLGRVVPGNAYAFSGTKKLEMYSGNAIALQVFYNQNDLGVLGLAGEVVRLVFTAEGGLMTPTAAFTATPTATNPPTITPLPTSTPKATATITPFVP